MNGQIRVKLLRQQASGATRTYGQPPEHDKFMHIAARAQMRGNHVTAAILRAEASNATSRATMTKAHCPNLGPYSPANPAHCIHCMKPMNQWIPGEICIPIV